MEQEIYTPRGKKIRKSLQFIAVIMAIPLLMISGNIVHTGYNRFIEISLIALFFVVVACVLLNDKYNIEK